MSVISWPLKQNSVSVQRFAIFGCVVMACFGVARFANTCKVDANTGEALLNLNGRDGSVAYSSLHRERNLETYCNHDPSHYYLHFPCATNDLRILSFNIIFFNTFPAFF